MNNRLVVLQRKMKALESSNSLPLEHANAYERLHDEYINEIYNYNESDGGCLCNQCGTPKFTSECVCIDSNIN